MAGDHDQVRVDSLCDLERGLEGMARPSLHLDVRDLVVESRGEGLERVPGVVAQRVVDAVGEVGVLVLDAFGLAEQTEPVRRKVALKLYTEPHNRSKTAHAMRSLKQAMQWDEQVYGLEYDLDTFMIVVSTT